MAYFPFRDFINGNPVNSWLSVVMGERCSIDN
jgi:hypothetical protein